jgi:oligoendopeptidase F
VIEHTIDNDFKKAIISWRMGKTINYLMSIRAAFLFEKEFYEVRKHGLLQADQIEEISLHAQETAFGNALSHYQPYVWMKYEHFFQPEVPFYNYPYTFGYLFSLGLLKRSKSGGASFSIALNDFLSLTGTQPIEALAKNTLGIDLAEPDFWQDSLKVILMDIEEYSRLT